MNFLGKRLLAWSFIGLAALVLLQGCRTVPVTGRQSLSLVSEGQELQLGLASFEEMKKEVPVSRNASARAMVERVGLQIARAASNDMPNAQWEFVVFESKDANAFCLPGGKVGVFTGLLPIAGDDAGLATVIGHEVAHAVARHGGERMSEAMLMQTGGQVLGAGLGVGGLDGGLAQAAMLAYGLGTKLGRELPHSRAQESEADHIGLIYMARAGYDPTSAIGFWERFSQYNESRAGGDVPAFLRTHPVDEVRIKDLRRIMPKAKAEFARSKLQ